MVGFLNQSDAHLCEARVPGQGPLMFGSPEHSSPGAVVSSMQSHLIRCPTCAQLIDMRSLDQVLAHERVCPANGAAAPKRPPRPANR